MIIKDIKNCERQFLPADIILLIVQLGTRVHPETAVNITGPSFSCIYNQSADLNGNDSLMYGYAYIKHCQVRICPKGSEVKNNF